jgi:hypothetical protein
MAEARIREPDIPMIVTPRSPRSTRQEAIMQTFLHAPLRLLGSLLGRTAAAEPRAPFAWSRVHLGDVGTWSALGTRAVVYAIGLLALVVMLYGVRFTLSQPATAAQYAAATYVFDDLAHAIDPPGPATTPCAAPAHRRAP